MPKNIVVCFDGTANEFGKNLTNVVKLYDALVKDPVRQVVYYHPGIGTMEAAGALTTWTRWATRVAGMAFGYGLESDIRDAYVFLMNSYEPGDDVYLFGFSRGAYTVRAVAALLHGYGVIRPGNEPLVPYAIRMLSAIHCIRRDSPTREKDVHDIFRLEADFKATFSRTDCKLKFVGVWDTVSSVGWIKNPLILPYTANNPDIEIGRHALAIDERRAFFRTNRWMPGKPGEPSGPKDVKQVWFPGVHSDIGGGYPEKDSGLAKIALEWMLKEAVAAGLLVDPAKRDRVLGKAGAGYAAPDPKAEMHESLKGAWRLAEIVPKQHYDSATGKRSWRVNLARRRTIPEHALIHESAYQRGPEYQSRLPANATRVG
jgi:uncharacterized protein (DUF2235 family)